MSSTDRKIQRAGAAKQKKKTHAGTIAAAKKKVRAAPVHKGNDEPLPPEVEARLSEIVAQVVSLHRKSTAQVFELGECLAEAKSVQPEKRFGRWLKERCNYTVRSAWNFISVHERLGDHRVRLEKHAVGTTALFELAKGEPDQINAVLDAYDEGKSLTGAEIKALVGGNKDEAAENSDPRQLGGKAGLQKIAAAKLKSDMDEFHRLTALVLVELEDAVSRVASGKRIVMRSLANEIEMYARHASDLFKDVAAPLRPVDHLPRGNLSHAGIGNQTGWGAVQHSLYRLGGAGTWPGRDEMEKWVLEVAHPALRFAVHGEPYVAITKLAVVPINEVANTGIDATNKDQPLVDKEDDTDEAGPSVSEADLDATLNSLTAVTGAPAAAHMTR